MFSFSNMNWVACNQYYDDIVVILHSNINTNDGADSFLHLMLQEFQQVVNDHKNIQSRHFHGASEDEDKGILLKYFYYKISLNITVLKILSFCDKCVFCKG